MKPKTLALLSAAGMLFTSVSVYSLTPAGGPHGSPDAGEETAKLDFPERKADPPTQTEVGRFVAGSTVSVDARLGHSKVVKNAKGETFVMLELKAADTENGKVAAP